MTQAGFDRSHYQAVPTVAALQASGMAFGITKATEGTGNFGSGSNAAGLDVTYAAARTNIRAAGLTFGSYHLGRPGSGAAQWAHYRALANPQPDELIALDVEAGDPTKFISVTEAAAFVAAGRADGYRVGVYGVWATVSHIVRDWSWPVAVATHPADLTGMIVQDGGSPFGDADTYHGSDVRALTTGGTMAAIDDVAKACGLTTETFVASVQFARGEANFAAGGPRPTNSSAAAGWDFAKFAATTGGGGVPSGTFAGTVTFP